MLALAKKKAGLSTPDLVFRCRVMPAVLLGIENGRTAYSMNKCFNYLGGVGYALQFSKGQRDYTAVDNGQLVDWMEHARGRTSAAVFAEKVGCRAAYVRLLQKRERVMSVDMMLKIAEATGFKISLVRCGYDG